MVQMEIGWKPRADDRLICLAVEALAVHIGKPVVGFSALLMSAIMFAQNENVAPQDLKIVTTEQDISSERSSVPSFSTTVYVHGPRIRHESRSDNPPIGNTANPVAHRAVTCGQLPVGLIELRW
jgi:hypothetical protein